MKRMLNITRKKRCQIPRSWLGLCSHGFMKLHFKTLRERCHDWSKAGGARIICFGKCASTLILQRVQSVSLPHVTYARQTKSDRGWKVRTRQCQQASGCFRSNAPIFRVQPFELARAAFTIYLCSTLMHRWHLSVYWHSFKIFYDVE